MDQEPDEDSINATDLQAQIDLSMSFASSLATSWIKTRRTAQNSRKRETESQVWEAAKRPPRLGVGTSVSQVGVQSSREIARLKGLLVGKKRGRGGEEHHVPQKLKKTDDTEEESRAGAIKKRVKMYPFDTSRKKKEQAVSTPTASSSTPTLERENPSTLFAAKGLPEVAGKSKATPMSDSLPFKAAWDTPKAQTKESVAPTSPKSNQRSKELSHQDPDSRPTESDDRPKSTYLALVNHLSPKAKLSFNQPLLNLSGHSGSEDDCRENPSPMGPKKKRKRKKKKNHSKDVRDDSITAS